MNTNMAIDKLIRDLSPKMREALITGVNDMISFLASRATWDALARRGLLVSHENARGNVHTTRKLNVEGQKARAILLDLANLDQPEARKLNDEFDAKRGVAQPKVCGQRAVWNSGLACERAPHDDNGVSNPLGWAHSWESSWTRSNMAEIHGQALLDHAEFNAAAEVARGVGHGPRFPEGTPEYAAYEVELRAELAKFAKGEAPYEFAPELIERLYVIVARSWRARSNFGDRAPWHILRAGVTSPAPMNEGLCGVETAGQARHEVVAAGFAPSGGRLCDGCRRAYPHGEAFQAQGPRPAVVLPPGFTAMRPVEAPPAGATWFEHAGMFRPGFVAGDCGHAVAVSEWRAGMRACERCPAGAPVIEREIGGVPSVLSRLVDGKWRPVWVGEHVRGSDGGSFAVEGVALINGALWVIGAHEGAAARAPIGWPSVGTLAWRPAAGVEAASDGPADPSAGLAVIPSDAPLISYDEDREVARHLASKVNQCGYAPGVPAYELAQAILRGYVEHVTPEGLDELRRGAGELS